MGVAKESDTVEQLVPFFFPIFYQHGGTFCWTLGLLPLSIFLNYYRESIIFTKCQCDLLNDNSDSLSLP